MVIREFGVDVWREFIHVMLGYPDHLKKFITQNCRGRNSRERQFAWALTIRFLLSSLHNVTLSSCTFDSVYIVMDRLHHRAYCTIYPYLPWSTSTGKIAWHFFPDTGVFKHNFPNHVFARLVPCNLHHYLGLSRMGWKGGKSWCDFRYINGRDPNMDPPVLSPCTWHLLLIVVDRSCWGHDLCEST